MEMLIYIAAEPTNNNETCELPYESSTFDNTNVTSWDMWFCYENQCPTSNQQLSTCVLGKICFFLEDITESNKTNSISIIEIFFDIR